MKKNYGVLIFIASISLTSLGSIFKLMHVKSLPDVLLGLGVTTCIIAIVKIVFDLFQRTSQT